MKPYLLSLLLWSFLIFSSCSSVKIVSDIGKGVDYTQYKTYTWSEVEEPMNAAYQQFDNSLNRARFRKAIDMAMQSHGYILAEGKVDLEVDFHLQFEHKAVPYHTYNNNRNDHYAEVKTTSVYQYDQGSLIIHLVDLKQEQIVWQGVSSRILDSSMLDKADENIQKTINKMFDKFLEQKVTQL